MSHVFRALWVGIVVTVVAALAAVLPVQGASAETSYTWTGSLSNKWDVAQNWSPQQVPGPDDVVRISSSIGTTTVEVPGEVVVGDLSITETTYNLYLKGAGRLTTTGSFEWTGGDLALPIVVAGSGRIGAGELKALTIGSAPASHGSLTVSGTLLLDDIGSDPSRGIDLYPDYDGDNDGIRIESGGTLRAGGVNTISGTGCCTDPAKVVNDGTIDVTGGRTTFRAVELTLRGTTRVAVGGTLATNTGSVRLGRAARYTGGGTVDLTETAAIDAHPNTAAVPGGVLMEGTGQLEESTRLHFGMGAKLTGVGGFSGRGTVELSASANPGHEAAHVYGDLAIGADTTLRLGGTEPSRLEVRDPGLAGYHGILRIAGTAQLAGSFVTQAGTATVVTGRLRLTPGSTWGEGDCCLQPATLTNSGTLEVTSGRGSAARITRVDLRNRGTLALAAGKRLVTVGRPVRLGGTLRTADRPGPQRTVLTGQQIIGTFDCVQPAGQAVGYSATTVRTTGVLGKVSGCAGAAGGRRLIAKRVGRHKTLRIKATHGLAKKVKKVLIAVTVSKVRRSTRIKVGGAPAVKAAKGRTTTRYLVAKRKNGKFLTVRNAGRKPVRIIVTLLGPV